MMTDRYYFICSFVNLRLGQMDKTNKMEDEWFSPILIWEEARRTNKIYVSGNSSHKQSDKVPGNFSIFSGYMLLLFFPVIISEIKLKFTLKILSSESAFSSSNFVCFNLK